MSKKGIEVNKVKIKVIEKLFVHVSMKGFRSFLGHADFYRRFFEEFSKISHPLCKLLEKEMNFV